MPVDPSSSPLLCDPNDKARLETENGVDQVDYITYLVMNLSVANLQESHVLEFHKLAVQNIYPCAGTYRTARFQVQIRGSGHEVPHESRVASLVKDMVEYLNETQHSKAAIERSAYALWRINWIHPFAGGNGRTARALSYLVLCIDMEMMIPGKPTFPTLIYGRRGEYVQALQQADESVRKDPSSEPNLEMMTALVEDVVTQQMANAINQLAHPGA